MEFTSINLSANERWTTRVVLQALPSITSPAQKWGGSTGVGGMGMHYKCIKAVEQKAYCLFIYLIGSNYASMYSERRQAKPIAMRPDSYGHNLGANDPHAKAANDTE